MTKTFLFPRDDAVAKPKILVVGDLIVDNWIHGEVERYSPEAACPVFTPTGEFKVQWGGAGAVALMAARMGGDVRVIGRLGHLPPGVSMPSLYWGGARYVGGSDPKWPQTVKARYVTSRGTVMRVDREQPTDWAGEKFSGVFDEAIHEATAADVVLIADYGHGVCCRSLLKALFQVNKRCIVDPRRKGDWSIYEGCWGIKCNHDEYWDHRGDCQPEWLLRTDGPRGATFFDRECHELQYQSEVVNVADPCGCGDQVLATLGVIFAETLSLPRACFLAIEAATLQARRPGIVPVDRYEIAEKGCVINMDIATRFAQAVKESGRRVVFTNGCFDLFHLGHLESLNNARKAGDVLIVGVNSDTSYQKVKGWRPVRPDAERAAVLAALGSVDAVFMFDEPDACLALRKIMPNVYFKGATSPPCPEWTFCREHGIELVIGPEVPSISSTAIRTQLAGAV